MGEVIDAVVHLIHNPKATVAELMRFIPGPDFPTAGIILGRDGIRKAYETGRGNIQVRARASVEVHPKTEREAIVVTEIPYQVNKAKLVEHIAELVREKRLEGISDLRDESIREGMRIVIELKRDAMAQVVLNNLYAHTDMQTGFGVITAGHRRRPAAHPRPQGDAGALHRPPPRRGDAAHPLRAASRPGPASTSCSACQIALDHIDEIIELIKKAGDRETARARPDGALRASPSCRPRPSWRCSCSASPAWSGRRSSTSWPRCRSSSPASRRSWPPRRCCSR